MKLHPTILAMTFFLSACGTALTAPPATPSSLPRSTALPSPTSIPPTAMPEEWCPPSRKIMNKFLLIGYLPDYRPVDPDWGKCLTDIIYFSAEPRPDGTLDTGRLNQTTLQALRQMKSRYGIRVHLSIGGWERSAGFGPMVVNPKARKVFAGQLLEFSLKNELDGADFDWEFPENEAELKGYIALLTELKAPFQQHKLQVSVTLSALENLDVKPFEVADRVQIMSYDRGPRHSTYDQAVQDLAFFIKGGIPAGKLILGVPFYGRNIQSPNTAHAYQEIMSKYQPSAGMDEVDGIYFNGIQTVEKKVCYALENNLGGVMFWELGQDTRDDTSLLRATYQAAVNGCAN
jgi:chitinase